MLWCCSCLSLDGGCRNSNRGGFRKCWCKLSWGTTYHPMAIWTILPVLTAFQVTALLTTPPTRATCTHWGYQTLSRIFMKYSYIRVYRNFNNILLIALSLRKEFDFGSALFHCCETDVSHSTLMLYLPVLSILSCRSIFRVCRKDLIWIF